jgi:hypothetical protein
LYVVRGRPGCATELRRGKGAAGWAGPVNDEIAPPGVVISSLTPKYEVNDEIAGRRKGLFVVDGAGGRVCATELRRGTGAAGPAGARTFRHTRRLRRAAE